MKKVKGIDISVWQGSIDFNQVKASGVDFVILREGYGKGNIDKNFLRYAEQISKVDGLDVMGVYHFSYAFTEKAARQEAKECVKHVLQAGLPKSTIIFFDFEYDTIDYAESKGVSLTKKECNLHTRAFCEEVERLGFKAGVYYNNDYRKHMYDINLLNKYVKWLADWTGEPDSPCHFHQYSSEGQVPGIRGNVDMNYYFDYSDEKQETKSIDQLVQEIFEGVWGDGDERKQRLTEAGHDYKRLQYSVNKIDQVAKEVVAGGWGNGDERKEKLEEAGYTYDTVQCRVNQLVEEAK